MESEKIPILGTSPDAIDLAEDRQRFQNLLDKLALKQPPNGTAYSAAEAEKIAKHANPHYSYYDMYKSK